MSFPQSSISAPISAPPHPFAAEQAGRQQITRKLNVDLILKSNFSFLATPTVAKQLTYVFDCICGSVCLSVCLFVSVSGHLHLFTTLLIPPKSPPFNTQPIPIRTLVDLRLSYNFSVVVRFSHFARRVVAFCFCNFGVRCLYIGILTISMTIFYPK